MAIHKSFKTIFFVIVFILCDSFKRYIINQRFSSRLYNYLNQITPQNSEALYNGYRRNSDVSENASIKDFIVNKKQKERMATGSFTYRLKVDQYPVLKQELDEYLNFMTDYTIYSQEESIRMVTAKTYISHAKLFFGWYIRMHNLEHNTTISIKDIIKDKEKQSSKPIIKYIQWLSKERKSSHSYETNVLRGLCKLIKFRFATESTNDGIVEKGKSYYDIPIVNELRKQVTLSQKKMKNSGRASDEKKKWLTWEEYLEVINMVQNDTQLLIEKYQNTVIQSQKEYVALNIQKFLLLSFFSQIPDRQRTFRELELGTNFVKENLNWIIRHSQDDYKTGRTYGERPPLILSDSLTPYIDDFIINWRPKLSPTTNKLFVQKSTGAPLTRDSIYSIVSTTCFKYKGKRTNPHLLRDMIVTHVRQSDASEKELNSLALYMGHSIAMQRDSYDRRTVSQKVMPAVELLQSISKSKGIVPLT